MYAEGIAQCQKALKLSPEMPGRLTLAWAYAMAGRRSEAIQILNEVKGASQNSIPHLRVAKVYGALGEKDQAMLHLEMAHAEHREGLLWLKVDPEFDGLRSDPRFDNLLRRIGFPA
jgi:predicted Zn-dependent protease